MALEFQVPLLIHTLKPARSGRLSLGTRALRPASHSRSPCSETARTAKQPGKTKAPPIFLPLIQLPACFRFLFQFLIFSPHFSVALSAFYLEIPCCLVLLLLFHTLSDLHIRKNKILCCFKACLHLFEEQISLVTRKTRKVVLLKLQAYSLESLP